MGEQKSGLFSTPSARALARPRSWLTSLAPGWKHQQQMSDLARTSVWQARQGRPLRPEVRAIAAHDCGGVADGAGAVLVD